MIRYLDENPTPVKSRVRYLDEAAKAPIKKTSFERQEERIASHPDLLKEAAGEVMKGGGIGTNLKFAGGLIQRATSAAVNPIIEAQKDPWALVDPRKYGEQVKQGLTGQKRAELGDLYVGAGAGDKTAAALGLGTEVALTAPELIANAPRNIQKFGQAAGRYLEGRGAAKATKRFGEIRKGLGKAKAPAEELYSGIKEARSTSGKKVGEFVDANADAQVNPERLNSLIEQLPSRLKDEIKSNLALKKKIVGTEKTTFDSMGLPKKELSDGVETLDSSLKNAETIRAIIRGDVPASKFNPKMLGMDEANAAKVAYDEIGKIMTEGRPDLAGHMKNYAEIMEAYKTVVPKIKSGSYTKSKPLITMLAKSAEGGDELAQQALIRLSKENPKLITAIDKAAKFGEGVRKTKYMKGIARKAAGGAATVAGGGSAWQLLT